MRLDTSSKIVLNCLAAGLGGALVGKFSGNTRGGLCQGAVAAVAGIALPVIHKESSSKLSVVAPSTFFFGCLLGGVAALERLSWKVTLSVGVIFGVQACVSLQQEEPIEKTTPEKGPDQGFNMENLR